MGIAAAGLVALLLASTSCSGDRGGFGSRPSPTPEPPAISPEPLPRPLQVVVRAREDFRFEPASIRAQAGRALEIVLRNEDDRAHTFVVDELNVLMLAGRGQTVRAAVAIHRGNAGMFAFYCQIPGHRAGGMEGRVRVVPPGSG